MPAIQTNRQSSPQPSTSTGGSTAPDTPKNIGKSRRGQQVSHADTNLHSLVKGGIQKHPTPAKNTRGKKPYLGKQTEFDHFRSEAKKIETARKEELNEKRKNKELKNKNEELEIKNKKIKDTEEALADLRSQLENKEISEREKEDLTKQIEDLDNELNGLENEVEKLEKERDELNQQLTKTTRHSKELENKQALSTMRWKAGRRFLTGFIPFCLFGGLPSMLAQGVAWGSLTVGTVWAGRTIKTHEAPNYIDPEQPIHHTSDNPDPANGTMDTSE